MEQRTASAAGHVHGWPAAQGGSQAITAALASLLRELGGTIVLAHHVRSTADLPPAQVNSTSDDYTDMSWHAPTARVYVARPALRAPAGSAYPSWVMNALGGIAETIDPMVVCAAKTVALSALRLIEDKAARDDARREFVERTGGGIGGERWLAPLCDYEPPIHFRWPEYVTTSRGREWWIPTSPNA